MHTRRGVNHTWERDHQRGFIYSGVGKGANIAVWKQAAVAELAAAKRLHYAQALIDLVKAFDRIPHWVLIREPIRLGYPLWLLRLALAP